MVFQSPHGRLNYSFMLLDRDLAYFILFYFTIDQIYTMMLCYSIIGMSPHSNLILMVKHMLGMNL